MRCPPCTSTVIPANVVAGVPVTITVTVYDPVPILYLGIYLHLPDNSVSHLKSDAHVAYDSGRVRITDPGGLMHDVSMTVSENDPKDPAKRVFTLTATFSESMGATNMVIRTWNTDRQSSEVRVVERTCRYAPDHADPEPGLTDLEPAPIPDASANPEPVEYRDPDGREMLASTHVVRL